MFKQLGRIALVRYLYEDEVFSVRYFKILEETPTWIVYQDSLGLREKKRVSELYEPRENWYQTCNVWCKEEKIEHAKILILAHLRKEVESAEYRYKTKKRFLKECENALEKGQENE